ncbi:hypothetical protein D3C72_2450000 [compost metagenome]
MYRSVVTSSPSGPVVNARRSTVIGFSPGDTSMVDGTNVGGLSSSAYTVMGSVRVAVRAVVSPGPVASVTVRVMEARPA